MSERTRSVVRAVSSSVAPAILVVIVLGAPGEGAAQGTDAIDRPRVSLEIDDACAVERAPLERVLAVELGTDADLEALPDQASSRVSVVCDGSLVRIQVDDALTHKMLERRLDLAGASPDARARLVALGIAELLAAGWIELGMGRAPELEETRPAEASSEEARSIALEVARRRLTLLERPRERDAPAPEGPRPIGIRAIAVGSLSGADPQHFAGGGGLAMDAELLAPLALLVDLRVEHASGRVEDAGSFEATALWAAAMLALRLPLGLHHADFGVGVRGGAGWLDGFGAAGVTSGSQVGPLLSAIGAAHLSLHIGYAAYLHLGLELGWVLVPLYGTLAPEGRVVAQIGGGQAAITMGFEVRPD